VSVALIGSDQIQIDPSDDVLSKDYMHWSKSAEDYLS
jgi:hypothetical protein